MSSNTIVVMTNGKEELNRGLARWLVAKNWRFSNTEYGIAEARDKEVVRFLREDTNEYLIMIDIDIIPLDNSILLSRENLSYCGYVGRDGTKGHYGDSDFGCGCSKIARSVLEKLASPYYKMIYEGNVRKKCECRYMMDRCAEIKVYPKMVGVCGHIQRCMLIPDSNGLTFSINAL